MDGLDGRTDGRTDGRLDAAKNTMNDKSDALTNALISAFATGIFCTMTIVLFKAATEAATIDDIKRTYIALAATGCGAIFFALFTAIMFDDARRLENAK